MKKMKGNGKKNNIIQFPELEKRLLEKGQGYLQHEQFDDAIAAFREALMLDPALYDGYIGLALAYNGAGFQEKAIEMVRFMLHEDMGDYFSLMDLYIKLLYEARKYTDIIAVIEGLIEERVIPSGKLEHYYSMLEISRQMLQQGDETEEIEGLSKNEIRLHLHDYSDQQDQLMLAAKLAKINIHPYLEEIFAYLRDASGEVFFKTLLLSVLKEHHVEQSVEIQKFARRMSVIPNHLDDVNEMAQLQEIVTLVGRQIEHDDPVLFESIRMLIHRQFFLFYPFPLVGAKLPVWAAAYHLLGLEYFGSDAVKAEILEDYHVSEDEFAFADSYIRMIEEISCHNI